MGMMWKGCLLVLAGCYAPSITAGSPCTTDADCPHDLFCAASGTCERTETDASIDGTTPGANCWAAWLSGTIVLSPPTIVDELSSLGADSNPSLADGDRTIFLTRAGLTGNDIFSAERPSPTARFSLPLVVLELASVAGDSRVTVSMDGKVGVLASERAGGAGASDLWYTTRNPGQGTFTMPTQQLVGSLLDADPQFDPELSPSGLAVYYSHAPGTIQHLMFATRAGTTAAFGSPEVIPLTGAMAIQADPTLSPDERVLVFASGTSAADTDLYYATRASSTAAFGAAKLLDINSTAPDSDPELASDGCTLFFSSNRAPAQSRDIWVSTVLP